LDDSKYLYLKVSNNTIPLIRQPGVSLSQGYTNIRSSPSSDIEIRNYKDQVYATPIKIGDQEFLSVLDTGSSDTWVIGTGYKCNNNAAIGACLFGPTYNRSKTFSSVGNKKFSIQYSGENLDGILGKETVRLGNITVTEQQFAVINNARWKGDGMTSGLIGMAFPSGSATWNDLGGAKNDYTPLFTSMARRGLTPNHFSIAINRAEEGPGALALGGLPGGAIRYSKDFVKTRMQYLVFGNEDPTKKPVGSSDYRLYYISIDGFSIGTTASPHEKRKIQINLDSGTTPFLLPIDVAKSFNAGWSPAAKYDRRMGYTVECTARAPRFGIKITGTTFWIDGKDLVVPAEKVGGACASAVQEAAWPGGMILGAAFMRNVVSVFDIGAAEMRFAARLR
jgi:hypothetical protein